ncbi:MAG: Ig-like domain-containing protein, partial [Thermoplasmata archaeon]
DTGGLSSWTTSGLFEIDSTAPSVLSTVPVDLEPSAPVTTNVEATFDEGMDTVSVELAFELRDVATWTLVPGTFSWVLDTVVFNPMADLNPGTTYQANISTLAKDDSDPGNPIAAQYEWTFTTATLNTPPSVSMTSPVGGESWSGGSVHDIVFTTSDNEDVQANLLVWLNYSTTGGAPWTPIAGAQGIAGDSSPYTWTLPFEDSATVAINATVVDTGGLSSWTTSGLFEIDSTPPSVLSTSPLDGVSGVPLGANVMAIWSESMNTDQTNASFTLLDNLTWTPVSGIMSWAGTTFVFNPDVNLNPNEWYTANFTTAAVDDSDPGNALLATYSWSFQTAGFVDNTPPSIANVLVDPTPQEVFFAVNISADVSDDVEVGLVMIEITDPLAGSTTTPMLFDAGTLRYYLDQTYSIVGTYDINITAADTSNNLNWSVGQFVIQDTTPPNIVHTAVTTELEGIPIDIAAVVQDNYALSPVDPVWLNYTDVLGSTFNISMNPVGGDNYSQQIPAQVSPGTVSYFIWAIDSEGNDAMTATYVITILAVDVEPPEILNALAAPSPQEVFGSVNITATITDPSGVASASVEITRPDSTTENRTLTPAPGDIYYLEQSYILVGTYSFTVWANDTNDFWNSSSGIFVIEDTTPPVITHTPVTSGSTGVPINISATVTDNYQLSDVRIEFIDTSLNTFNESMISVGGDSYSYQIPAQVSPGVVTYFVWAIDSSGNPAMTAQYDITVSTPPDNQPPEANAGPDQLNNSQGTMVQFNGTASSDNVGIVSYRWTFTYGPNVIMLEGPTPSFTFMDVGEYTVTLNVTDAAGLYDTDAMIVSVLDSTPPEIVAVSPPDGATDIPTTTDYIIVFSEEMDTAVTQQAITIQGITIENFEWTSGNTRLRLTLSGLKENQEYSVEISGAADVTGNTLTTQSFSFTTMEVPSPPPSFSLEQDWWWIVLIIILIVIIVMLALRRPPMEAEELTVFEPAEAPPPFEPEDLPEPTTEEVPEEPEVSPGEGVSEQV